MREERDRRNSRSGIEAEARAKVEPRCPPWRESEERARREEEERPRREKSCGAPWRKRRGARETRNAKPRGSAARAGREARPKRSTGASRSTARRKRGTRPSRTEEEALRAEEEENRAKEYEKRAREEEKAQAKAAKKGPQGGEGERKGRRTQGRGRRGRAPTKARFPAGDLGKKKARQLASNCGDVAPDLDSWGCRASLCALGIRPTKNRAGLARGAGQDRHLT